MKLISIMILVVLCLSSLSQITLVVPYSESNTQSILMLNVCHSSDTGILNNSDAPFIYESLHKLVPLRLSSFLKSSNSIFNQFLIAFQKEYPPEV